MQYLISILYSAVLIVSAYLYLERRYALSEVGTRKEIIVKHRLFAILTMIIFVIFCGIALFCLARSEAAILILTLKCTTIFWGCYLLAKIDYHEKLIPNEIIIILIGIRGFFLVCETVTNLEYWTTVLIHPLLGAFLGFLIMMVAMFVSRNGVGMGDVKLFFVIGAYVGSTGIIPTMFYTFFVSAVVGIILLITKKAGLKDSVPMAPFAFCGIAIECVLLMIGG